MRWTDAIALAVLAIVVAALSVGSVRLDSATMDEPAHIANGILKLQERWMDFFREQPPLMNSMSALPVFAAGYRIQPRSKSENHWVAGRRFLYRSGYDAYRILFLARLPTIALFVALVLVVYWFVLRQTASPMWALGAAALTAFCPNLMAHGRLATVDMALTFFAFSASALLLVLLERPSAAIAVLLGVATSAAILSKVSGLILGPYFVIVIAMSWRKIDWKLLAVACVSAIAFFFAFMFAVGSANPIADYIANIAAIRNWYAHGNELPSFFLGRFSSGSWPMYYPVAFLLKTTLPAILLVVLALTRPRRAVPLVAFVAIFFVAAMLGNLALGVRYILPVYPFLYAAVAIALARETRAVAIAVVVLIAWHAGENIAGYPGYISYFNELIGSPRNADKFLIDSNLDWGQDLRRLDFWCREHGVQSITVHYFGGGDPQYEIRSARPAVILAPVPRLPRGWFALSRHFYRLSFDPEVFGIDYDAYLEAQHARYVATVGGSIDVYRVE
ncbi:MAG TPA: phospholipid carrier-dependent glycosyltransferase [Thermoanaerobaculia bacterium]|nr:phospholipid carrier-dependent glycosyltransferase [Thermoanaerobaculia bacterium]